MKLIIGLGNPGRKYQGTRHNIGYRVVEEFARRFPVEKEESRFDAIIGHTRIKGEKILLVKPLTYMNLSGKAVGPLVNWFKLDLKDIIVAYDDMDLPVGTLRIREKGGTGGHKGLASVSAWLSSKDFARIRIGIGRPDHGDVISWVLGKFDAVDEKVIADTVLKAADALQVWVQDGIAKAMNAYN
ncbi:MAG: aminoacyl-tRNA hydrolase [Syntrophomonadaceae bacterium]|jgi:PTH1 family peptidyl-tRNA hydrolase